MVQRLPADFMALGIIPRFAVFYCQVFHNFHIFTLYCYSPLFQISVFADTLRIFATPHVG